MIYTFNLVPTRELIMLSNPDGLGRRFQGEICGTQRRIRLCLYQERNTVNAARVAFLNYVAFFPSACIQFPDEYRDVQSVGNCEPSFQVIYTPARWVCGIF